MRSVIQEVYQDIEDKLLDCEDRMSERIYDMANEEIRRYLLLTVQGGARWGVYEVIRDLDL